jgi:hypothetical protein
MQQIRKARLKKNVEKFRKICMKKRQELFIHSFIFSFTPIV